MVTTVLATGVTIPEVITTPGFPNSSPCRYQVMSPVGDPVLAPKRTLNDPKVPPQGEMKDCASRLSTSAVSPMRYTPDAEAIVIVAGHPVASAGVTISAARRITSNRTGTFLDIMYNYRHNVYLCNRVGRITFYELPELSPVHRSHRGTEPVYCVPGDCGRRGFHRAMESQSICF